MPQSNDVHDVIVMIGNCVLGTWLEAFIREAYGLSEHPVELHLGDGDYILPDIGRSEGEPRVMMMLGPGEKQMEVVAGRAVPVVAALDDPSDSVRFTMQSKSATFLDGVRLQTKYSVANYIYLDNPAVMLVARGVATPARTVLGGIMTHLGLRVRTGEDEDLLERFGGPADAAWSVETALAQHVPLHLPLDQIGDALDTEQLAIIREALVPLARGAVTAQTGSIVWRSKVFMFGDKPTEAAPPVADATGAARIIFFGPYFHLPPGEWEVHVLIAFSAETRGETFRLFLFAQFEPIAKVRMKPDEGGAFEARFTVTHLRPDHHLEIHFRNDVGLIEGHVALGQMRFSRLIPKQDTPVRQGPRVPRLKPR